MPGRAFEDFQIPHPPRAAESIGYCKDLQFFHSRLEFRKIAKAVGIERAERLLLSAHMTTQSERTLAPAFLRRGWPRWIALTGYFLPVLVGLCVRAYLQRIGKPVLEWSWFFNPGRLAALAISLAYWDIPFLLIAAMSGSGRYRDSKNRFLVPFGFLGTAFASILVFADLWKNIEAIVMGTILIPFFVLPGTLAGLGIGWLAGRVVPRQA